MISLIRACTLAVYVGFVLYGLHSQSLLLRRYLTQLDNDAAAFGDGDEFIIPVTTSNHSIRIPPTAFSTKKVDEFNRSNNTKDMNRSSSAQSRSYLRRAVATTSNHSSSTQPKLLSIPKGNNNNNNNNDSSSSFQPKKATILKGKNITSVKKYHSKNSRLTAEMIKNRSSYHKYKNHLQDMNVTELIEFMKSTVSEDAVEKKTHEIHNFSISGLRTRKTSFNVTSEKPFRKWAYAFLVGGCSPDKPEYRGFIYNVAVAAQRLQDVGSKADVVVFVQMSYTTNDTRLPEDEERLLEGVGVRIEYLPKFSEPVHEKFYALVQEKFRILELIEYSRVLFLDSDIMPLCNLDYLFELSEPEYGPPVLKENIVLSWRREPCNAGLFMLRPDQDDYIALQRIIYEKEKKALSLPWPHWDPVEGWGHVIEAPDFWRTPDRVEGTNWTWHAVFADQGLLYHWTKYVKQSVSLIIMDEVENWGSKDGKAHMEIKHPRGMLNNYTCVPPVRGKYLFGAAPYRDFKHFTGRSKPWQMNQSAVFETMSMEGEPVQPAEKWYRALKVASKKTNFALNFSFAMEEGNSLPPVGRFSDYGSMINHITRKAENNWTAYEKEAE